MHVCSRRRLIGGVVCRVNLYRVCFCASVGIAERKLSSALTFIIAIFLSSSFAFGYGCETVAA